MVMTTITLDERTHCALGQPALDKRTNFREVIREAVRRYLVKGGR